MEKYVFLSIWWFGTIAWLINGAFALLAPLKWASYTSLRNRMPSLLKHPALIRLLGGAAICIGSYWAVEGVSIVSSSVR